MMYVAVALVYFGLFHTRWGLRSARSASTPGRRHGRHQGQPHPLRNVLLAGAIAGLGGTFFTLGLGRGFNREMTAGAGYIALAAVIFGKWDPIRATFAALLFGFASNLQGCSRPSARRCRASSC